MIFDRFRDIDAANSLAVEHIGIARAVAASYKQLGWLREDLISVGFLGLIRATRYCQQEVHPKERESYYFKCVRTETVNWLRSELKPHRTAPGYPETPGEVPFLERIADTSRDSDLWEVVEAVENQELLQQLMRSADLTPEELATVEGYLQDDSYEEIGRRLGKSKAAVNSLKQRAVKKLKVAALRAIVV